MPDVDWAAAEGLGIEILHVFNSAFMGWMLEIHNVLDQLSADAMGCIHFQDEV